MSAYEYNRKLIISKYGVPDTIKRGTPVRVFGAEGVITGFSGLYIRVRVAGNKYPLSVHPLEVAFSGESDNDMIARRNRVNARIDNFNAALNRQPKCQLCQKNDAVHAMQFIAEITPSFYALGSHIRGFRVTKVCDACKVEAQNTDYAAKILDRLARTTGV